MKKIRTRYAPSPTGQLHIGGARTALFSYLYAKHFNGKFVIRIEDTDKDRNVDGGENSQIDNLEWMGIIADESPRKMNDKYGPYRQSEKIKRYNTLIDELLEKDLAYKAYDSSEEISDQKLEQEKNGIFSFRYDKEWLKISDKEKERRDLNGEYTIRLSLKKDTIYSWEDIVRGKIEVNTNDIGDWVIKKQDGYPTYNFAVVVDDHDMEISHVLRGEEHTTNTPKQLAVYSAFNWEPPAFGHLTIITNMDGKKLSKRDTSLKQFIEDYKNEGYDSHAIFNFLSLLGWTHPEAKEKLTKEELIKSFNPSRLSKSPSKFDIKKMNWFAKEYMKEKPNNELIKVLESNRDINWLNIFLEIFKQNSPTINSLKNALATYDDKSIKTLEHNVVVKTFSSELNKVEFTAENIQEVINKTKTITGAKGKELFMPLRLSTTYQEHGPELAKAIYLVGETLIKERLK